MIQNFDLLKQQLSELSPIVNSFKSETVLQTVPTWEQFKRR